MDGRAETGRATALVQVEGVFVLVAGFAAGALGANCYLLAAGRGEACVVVDPGQDALEPLEAALAEHDLTPGAVLATHGHFDHVASAAEIARRHLVPVMLHPADHPMVPGGAALTPLTTGMIELAGLALDVDHAPGHTEGSVLVRVRTEEGGRLLISGDTLFAGSVGRTDREGGDRGRLHGSLRELVLPLPDETVVLPGHGPASTIGRERTTNPFFTRLDDD
ncbi:MBL fold metallo-hydrolase [Amycolatopsis minnesotensis]|uniref:MBL fold metallo-hydrolase n=1 Tax=Amycolatopsis minnesotensis TaxID=337894 RepID=A0ABP5DI49_9PSEU